MLGFWGNGDDSTYVRISPSIAFEGFMRYIYRSVALKSRPNKK